MKSLLTITAIFEASTGVALIAIPATIVPILLGIPFSDDNLHVISGVTGVALLSIAIMCWSFRSSGQQAAGIVRAILFYNFMTSLILMYGALGLGLSGLGLWPVVILHLMLALWSIVELRK